MKHVSENNKFYSPTLNSVRQKYIKDPDLLFIRIIIYYYIIFNRYTWSVYNIIHFRKTWCSVLLKSKVL